MTIAPMNSSPFFWGRGGGRMTPEDIALRRRLGAQQLAAGADFSPVGHWTQGLARVASGITGALSMRAADKASERNAADSSAQIAELLAGGGGQAEGGADPIAAILSDPYVSEQARDVATLMLRERNQAPPQPFRFEDNAGNQWEMGADGVPKLIFTDLAPRQYLQEGQLITVPNPYTPGASAPSQAQGAPPATLPPDFDFGAGGTAGNGGGNFRP